jgi:hypothetical protein
MSQTSADYPVHPMGNKKSLNTSVRHYIFLRHTSRKRRFGEE